MEFRVGDIIIVTANHPDGSATVTEGDIGIITKTEITKFGIDYTVHTQNSDYLYGHNQIRLATQEEKDVKLIQLIMR